jgi:hypothetical protein
VRSAEEGGGRREEETAESRANGSQQARRWPSGHGPMAYLWSALAPACGWAIPLVFRVEPAGRSFLRQRSAGILRSANDRMRWSSRRAVATAHNADSMPARLDCGVATLVNTTRLADPARTGAEARYVATTFAACHPATAGFSVAHAVASPPCTSMHLHAPPCTSMHLREPANSSRIITRVVLQIPQMARSDQPWPGYAHARRCRLRP